MGSKRALLTGVRGQDGAYLSKFLLERGYEVFGADRRSGDTAFWRLRDLGIFNDVRIEYMDLLELTNIIKTLERVSPDEIYNLAAQSFVATSFEQPLLTSDINAMGVLRILDAIKLLNANIKFYQASTSEMFGKAEVFPQNEKTPFHPRSPYGVAKLYGHWITVNYREAYNMFTCSGILFNHESPMRGLEFVTRKITHGVARIKYDMQERIALGNLDAKRDWGFAGDYVEGMWMMLQHKEPDDYVLATGESHSIREFAEAAFQNIDMKIEWEGEGENARGIESATGKTRIEVSREFYRPADVDFLIGDSGKAREVLGWKPRVSFRQLVDMMVEADLRALERWGV